jgi:hypothetical protein
MKTALAILVVVAASLSAQARQHSTFRVHTEANESSGPVFSTKLPLFGREVTIEKVPTLSENDVTGLETYRAADGTYGALFLLNEHGRLALDSLSVDRRGGRLYVFVNNRPITELQIDRRVSDGKIYIPAGLAPADIKLLRQDWPKRRK